MLWGPPNEDPASAQEKAALKDKYEDLKSHRDKLMDESFESYKRVTALYEKRAKDAESHANTLKVVWEDIGREGALKDPLVQQYREDHALINAQLDPLIDAAREGAIAARAQAQLMSDEMLSTQQQLMELQSASLAKAATQAAAGTARATYALAVLTLFLVLVTAWGALRPTDSSNAGDNPPSPTVSSTASPSRSQ